ncbi:Uncharacterised protein [Arthrobacter agilis]|nr:Uncharacterised protein [Arthrobacter agilis]
MGRKWIVAVLLGMPLVFGAGMIYFLCTLSSPSHSRT